MVRSIRSLLYAVVSFFVLALAGPLFTGAALASDFMAIPTWPSETSITFDRLGHAALLNTADLSEVRASAFADRGSTHDLFSAGGFTLNHFGMRC